MKKYKNLIVFLSVITLIALSVFIPVKNNKTTSQKTEKDNKKQALIARVETVQAETLDINYSDERSRPTCNTLPKGTVDYCKQTSDFCNLNSGHRLYKSNVKTYYGTLPDENNVKFIDSYISKGKLVLEFSQSFKAPFKIDFGNQDYKNPYPDNADRPDYSVNNFTCEEFKIEFSYCDKIDGSLKLAENSVFSDISSSGNTLILKLKNKNVFCGYTAEYNNNNNLCFVFTDCNSVSKADNKYGADLTGKTVMIDAGHGGEDCGATGNSEYYTESALNLILSKLIKSQLESIGATVIMTRTEDSELLLKERTDLIYKYKPDIFVSVHRNAAENTSAAGYENYYYYPFSKKLANCIFKSASSSFDRDISVKYYPFYVTRAATCPSVLTENGFVSNSEELDKIKLYDNNLTIAENTVKGITEYFLNLN